jgi:hypothetical protein
MKIPWKVLLLLLFPLGFLIFLGGDFAYPVRGLYSDLAISHYPNAEFLRLSLAHGEIPLWSPLLFAGYPFAANPLSGLHYPPGWLALFFALPFGFNLTAALHLIVAGVGMFLFLRNEGLNDWPALCGAIAFQAMPKLISHYAAGHLTLFYSVCLTPWLLWAEQIRASALSPKRLARAILPGVLLGVILLADLRWAPYAAGLWVAYAVMRASFRRTRATVRAISAWLGGLLLQVGVALAVSACLWLPLLEYVSLSTRAAMTSADRVGISLPVGNLLGVFIPSLGGYAEWELYAGALPWLLLIFTLAVPELRKRTWFWLAVLGISILAALGGSLPGYAALTELPGFSLLRVPSRALFLTGFAFAVMTAFALDHLSKNKIDQKPEPVFFMVPFAAFPLLIAGGLGLYLGGYYQPFAWAGSAIAISILLVLMMEKKWLPGVPVQILIGAFLLIELAVMDATLVQRKTRNEVIGAQNELLAYVLPDPAYSHRVYSPSFSLPQTVTAVDGLGMVDGIDPMQLTAYVDLLSKASGIPVDSYSVTMPPFKTGDPATDNISFQPDPDLLGLLNVKYVLSAFPLEVGQLEFVRTVDSVSVYENLAFRERAWVEGSQREIGKAVVLEYSANQVVLQAEGPGMLVLADTMYPGWRATLDGAAQPIQAYQRVLRAVQLSTGVHSVVFSFRPTLVYIGWGISLASWILICILAVIGSRRVMRGD